MRMAAAAADMFPVRVLVETVRTQHCLGCAHDGNPLVDTFAVVGGQTMLCQLVETVLSALGLPQLVQDSKGLIQINGWKPIAFETITDNPEELVANLFREISTHITLKILAKRSSSEPNGLCVAELKQRLLRTAIEKQPQILTTANGQEVKEILQQVIQGDQQCSAWNSREQTEAVNEWLEQMAAQQEDGGRRSPLCTTRFSPLSELPRLERWFRSDPNPSRQKLLSFMNILNASPYRRANNKVTYQQMCNWFINQRRTAQRNSRQQSAASSSAAAIASKRPMAMLPLNASGTPTQPSVVPSQQTPIPPATTTNLAMLNSLASALASGNLDPAQMQQKMATFLVAAMTDGSGDQRMAQHEQHQLQNHQIPMALGPPLDIRAKFEGCAEKDSTGAGSSQEGQQGGQHSDRMDGGSESPTGNDDMSEHSGTSEGPPEGARGDSMACCSPDELFMDVQQQQCSADQQQPSHELAHEEEHQEAGTAHQPEPEAGGLVVENGTTATGSLNLMSQLLQPPAGHQTPPPPPSTSSAAMAAAAAAFSSLMPTHSQLQLMNQLALASQFHHQHHQQQGNISSPTHPQPHHNPFGISNNGAIKSSPSSNSLTAAGREEMNGGRQSAVKPDPETNYSPSQQGGANGFNGSGQSGGSNSRSRLMFDPLSELPILERWFEENPHPGWLQIETYTEYLNSMAYRQNYPPISTHNVKIWFKNRRAKTKRLLSNNDASNPTNLTS